MATLKTICENALKQLTGFRVPSAFAASQEANGIACFQLANVEGRTLERRYRFQRLIKEGTITTANGTESYSLPSDFRAMAIASQWDRTDDERLAGPATSGEWQLLKSSLVQDGVRTWFKLRGNKVFLNPIPTSARTLSFDYFSKNWVRPANGNEDGSDDLAAFEADTDEPLLDDLLLEMGIRWRFLAAKGVPFQTEYADYEGMRDDLLAADRGNRIINLGDLPLIVDNLPDQNFGGVTS